MLDSGKKEAVDKRNSSSVHDIHTDNPLVVLFLWPEDRTVVKYKHKKK